MLQKLKYKKEIHIYFETINIIKLVNTFITSHSYCVYVMRTFKIDFISNHQIYNPVLSTKIMTTGSIIFWQKDDGEKVETVTDFIFLGSKITVDGD